MTRLPRTVSVAAVFAVLLSACGDDPPPSTTSRTHRHDPVPTTAVDPHGAIVTEVTDHAPARLVRSTGTVRVDAAPATEASPLDRGQRLELEAGAEAVIELAGGDRVTLFGPVLAQVGEEGAAGMTIVAGSAHVRVAPAAAGPRSPMRLATPESTVELIGPGEVLVVADASGTTWNVVMAGMSHIANGDADAHHHARITEIAAGNAVLFADAPAEPTAAPSRLDVARPMAQTIFGTVTPLEPSRLADRVAHAGTDLDTAFGWLETEARHGRDLTDEHRGAVAAGNSDEAMRLQRALVGHAQELHALRDTARLRWERLGALVLAGAVPVGGADPVAARRDRAAPLLGLE